jgi:hypothetical protein
MQKELEKVEELGLLEAERECHVVKSSENCIGRPNKASQVQARAVNRDVPLSSMHCQLL